jgi:two-component SAPR family response regulator
MVRTVIIDDELYAITGLKHELSKFNKIEVVGTYQSGADFVRDYPKLRPELIFLDIEMAGNDGLAVARQVIDIAGESCPHIVFVTAFSNYAVNAFEIAAIDYLVKPVTPGRLERTLGRLFPLEKIAIETFGLFTINLGNREIGVNWRSKKSEELFLYLLLQKGHFIAKDKIVNDIWPHLPPEKGFSNLYLNNYYVKNCLREADLDIPIISERGKMKMNLHGIECDFLLFDQYLKEMPRLSRPEQLLRFDKIISIYQGLLLDNYYFSWNEVAQRYYDVRFAEILSDKPSSRR